MEKIKLTPNELRIGNWLLYENEGKEFELKKIVAFNPQNVLKELDLECSVTVPRYWDDKIYTYDSKWLNHFHPVPLTEEWLIKLGFKKHKENGRYGYKYYIEIADYNYVVERDFNKHISHFFGIEHTDSPDPKDDYKLISFSFDLQYVHQLQNLFFALTHKELEEHNKDNTNDLLFCIGKIR